MTGTTKAFSAYPCAVIDDNVANGSDGDAEIPTSLVGKARFLAEFATGGPIEGDSAPAIPVNPQSTYGHDHSGPPYGPAFRHCLFATSGWYPTGADWIGEDLTWDFGSVSLIPLVFEGWIWVKPFPPVDNTPYSRGYISLSMKNVAANAGDMTVTLESNDNAPREVVIAAAASTADQRFIDSGYMFLAPGWNKIRITFEGYAATTQRLLGFSVNQIKKLSH